MSPLDASSRSGLAPAVLPAAASGGARPTVAPLPLDGAPALSVPADRPLLGLTILLVEDSRLASEGVRLMCLRSGARLRRADTLFAAERHLKAYRPGVVIVDLGLPDGSGLGLIRRLAQARPRIEAVIATSGDDSLEGAAIEAGARAFIAKPLDSLAAFQARILSSLPAGQAPRGPRALPEGGVPFDPAALRDDLCHAAEVLARGGGPGLDYVTQFLHGVAASADDAGLVEATRALGAARARGSEGHPEAGHLAEALLDRLSHSPAL